VADCLFVIETDGSCLPIILPMPRLRSVRCDDWLLLVLILDEIEDLVELTAGCFAPVGAEELRVPIELPIREVPLERAAGCSALLGTDGLVVSILLPIRDDMLGLILLLVLVVGLFVIVVRERLLDGALVLLREVERLLDGVLVLIELPIRDEMLGLIRLDVLVLGARLVMALLEMLLLGARLVIALLEMLLLGARLVIDRLEMLLLGVRLVIALLEMLLLGARLVMALLEMLLLGVRLVIARLDETLLELLEEVGLDVTLGADAGLEACRVCLLELLDLLLLDRFVAARTGSAISARISTKRAKSRGWKEKDRFPASP